MRGLSGTGTLDQIECARAGLAANATSRARYRGVVPMSLPGVTCLLRLAVRKLAPAVGEP